MNDIKDYKYIEQIDGSDCVLFIIKITYTKGQERYFQVKVNKEYGEIDSEAKRKKLFEQLKNKGVLDLKSAKEELDLQEVMKLEPNREGVKKKGEEGAQKASNNKKYRFTYLSIESEGESDVYNIQIIYPDGGKRKFKVKTNKGSVQISKNDTEGKQALVILLKEQGLIEQDSSNTEIELGTLIVQDGRLNIAPGKNYVCSDIHGMYERYMKAKSQLKPEDTLWVLGDATDRGWNGIKILQDIMKSSEKNGIGPQVKYILGNHDLMILQCMDAFEKTGMTDKEIVEYFQTYDDIMMYWYNLEQKLGRALTPEERDKYEIKIRDKKYRNSELAKMFGTQSDTINWACHVNDAMPTMWAFYDLSKEEQQEIREFLENGSLIVTRQFGDKKVALVHSMPPDIEPKINTYIKYKKLKNKNDWSEADKKAFIYSMIWDRRSGSASRYQVKDRYKKWKDAGYITIHGHTPTCSGTVELHPDGAIAIDTDASSFYGGLSVYCIEDGKVFAVTVDGIEKRDVEVISADRDDR